MNLKRITEILPLFGVFLVLLGYLKLYLYYNHWNIAIIDYLDISEITLLFLSDVHIIVAFVAIFLFPLTIGLAIIKYVEMKDEQRRESQSQQSTEIVGGSPVITESFSDHIQVKFVMMIACLIVAIVFISCFFAFNKIWLLYFSTFGFLQFVMTLMDYIFHNDNNDKMIMQITFVLSATAFSILVAHYDICKTERNPAKYQTTIIANDYILNTSASNLYIGKTNNYVFLYDKETKTSRTIKNEVVKEILIKEN